MAKKKLHSLAKKMKAIDFCMMTTVDVKGSVVSRPMSNNGDVDYSGKSYFFTLEASHLSKELKRNQNVNLSFQLNKKLYISVSGKAKIITDQAVMKKHWVKGLRKWFDDGLHTPGIELIEVKAQMIRFWERGKEREINLT